MATLFVFGGFFRSWRPLAGSILLAYGVSQALADGVDMILAPVLANLSEKFNLQ